MYALRNVLLTFFIFAVSSPAKAEETPCLAAVKGQLLRKIIGLQQVNIWFGQTSPVASGCIETKGFAWDIRFRLNQDLGRWQSITAFETSCGRSSFFDGPPNFFKRTDCDATSEDIESFRFISTAIVSVLGDQTTVVSSGQKAPSPTAVVTQPSPILLLPTVAPRAPGLASPQSGAASGTCIAFAVPLDMRSSGIIVNPSCDQSEIAARFPEIATRLQIGLHWIAVTFDTRQSRGGMVISISDPALEPSIVFWGPVDQAYLLRWFRSVWRVAHLDGAKDFSNRILEDNDPLPYSDRNAVLGRLFKWLVAAMQRLQVPNSSNGAFLASAARDWMAEMLLVGGQPYEHTLLRREKALRVGE